jgi:hypothetical protein
MPNSGYSWWDSVRSLVQTYNTQQPGVPAQPSPQQSLAPKPQPIVPAPVVELTDLEKSRILTKAAQTLTMVNMTYGNVGRMAEPYSFRMTARGLLLFAYCPERPGKGNAIKSFKFSLIQKLENTEIPFVPRWPVELGSVLAPGTT